MPFIKTILSCQRKLASRLEISILDASFRWHDSSGRQVSKQLPLKHTFRSLGLSRLCFFGWLGLSMLVLGLDQLTKHLAILNLEPYQSIPIIPCFNLTLVFNRGVAFSLLSGGGELSRYFLVGFAFFVALAICFWLYHTKHSMWSSFSLSLILGGAVGNLWDRLTLSYVVDFLDFYVGTWHWPVFNVADTAISVGILGVVISLFSHRIYIPKMIGVAARRRATSNRSVL